MKYWVSFFVLLILLPIPSCQWLPEVESVNLSANEVTLRVGGAKTLTASVQPGGAEYTSVKWTSSRPSVASVSDGVIHASLVGTAEITATVDGVASSPCIVTVEATKVTGVSLNTNTVEVTEGDSFTLRATVSPADATYQSVSWSSGNSAVASVDGYGRVTANSPGQTTITARTSEGQYSATCQVTVKSKTVSVTGVSLNKSSLSLDKGETTQLVATVSPSNATNKDVTWASNNPEAVFVASDGTVTANKIGTATITVKTDDGGKTATCSVTVKAVPVSSVTLSSSSLSMTEGEKSQLTATVSPSNATNKDLTWASNNTSVATVSSSGLVTAISSGSATITATSSDGSKKATCTVAVKASTVSVTGVSINPSSLTLQVGKTATLSVEVAPSNASNKSVTWSSGNTSVASVSSDGVVTAKKVGTTTITVKTADGGKTATCSVTVQSATVAVTGVNVSQTQLTLNEGESFKLGASVTPTNATNQSVSWSSSNTAVATVSSDGTVTAKVAGSARIIATSSDGGRTAYCSVLVVSKNVSVTGVSVSPSTLSLTTGQTSKLSATVSPSNATNKTVTWSSNNTSVATVASDGTVTAKAAGSATITCTTQDGSKKATCAVTVKAATVSVTGVSLDRSSMGLVVGSSGTLRATINPTNATNTGVSWSSSNTSVATVSTSGVVTAKAVGSATITVKTSDGSKTATCTVTVTAATISVTGVSVSPTSLSLTTGQTSKLSASVSPGNATNTAVTWSSSNTSVATVASDGTVIAKAAGSATITCTTQDGSKKASCSVTVSNNEPLSVDLKSSSGDYVSSYWTSGYAATLYTATTPTSSETNPNKCQIIADINASFATWSSGSDAGKLKVDNIDEVQYYFCDDVERITRIGDLNVRFRVSSDGETLYASLLNSNGSVRVSEEAIASIDNARSTRLGLTAWNMFSYDKGGTVANALINTESMYLYIGAVAYLKSDSVVPVTFNGSDHFRANLIRPVNVTVVASDTFVDGASFGSEDSYIHLEDLLSPVDWKYNSFSGHKNYWNYYGPWEIDVDLSNAECDLGGIRRPLPSTIRLVQISQGATSARHPQTGATVSIPSNSYGYLMYYNTGEAATQDYHIYVKVSGTYGFGDFDSDWVSIPVAKSSAPATISVTGVSLDKTSLSLEEGKTASLTATVSPTNATNKTVTWSSSNTSVAAVSTSGVVTAKATGSATITCTTQDGEKKATCLVTVTAATVSVTGVSLDKTSLSLEEGKTASLTATVSPSNATNKTVTWSSSNTSVATVSTSGVVTAKSSGSATITCTTQEGSKKATCSVTVTAATTGTENGHEWVDLGLSVKWATCNIGASKPEDKGSYFAWGESSSKSYFLKSNYKWFEDGSVSEISILKYNKDKTHGTVDNKTVLDDEDDAAAAIWKGGWRMPTSSEAQELLDNCDCSVVYSGDKVAGFVFKSRRNQNSIFIPDSGTKDGQIVRSSAGGICWTSTLHNYLSGESLCFLTSSSKFYVYASVKYFGLAIRPVLK